MPVRKVCACIALVVAWTAGLTRADHVTRNEALEIADAFAKHRWEASEKNVFHGFDRARIEVHTPNLAEGESNPRLWRPGGTNVGMPYKWGGFDSIDSFGRGIRAGKAAGDLYTPEKRQRGGAAVSSSAVGIDCSGFISRCWKMPRKYSTHSLVALCTPLRSASELLPADIMNTAGGHVLLFARWLDDSKKRALFYEAEPFSKVLTSERRISEMEAAGYRPLRFREIRD